MTPPSLDVSARELFHHVLIRDYGEHPRTVVFSTHLIEESASLFDRVVIMDSGRVVLDADGDEVRQSGWVMTGTTEAITRHAPSAQILSTTVVGGLMSATGLGMLDPAVRTRAAEHGLQISAASIQQLVAAYGSNETPSNPIEEVKTR